MSLNVILHPLVFLNISDHYNRVKVLKKKSERVIGCLFGKQTGRNLEVFNSFELSYKGSGKKGESIEVVEGGIKKQSDMLKQLFPEHEVIGWYSTSSKEEPEEDDALVHKLIQKHNENPIYLVYNVNPPPGRDVPLNIYEGNMQLAASLPIFTFQKISYLIASLPAERIAVEGVAKSHEAEAGSSKFALAMIQPLNAIKMLRVQLSALVSMIAAEPKLKTDQDFLRKLNNVMSRIPLITSPILASEQKAELAEVALVNELATMAKTIEILQDVAEKYNTMGLDK